MSRYDFLNYFFYIILYQVFKAIKPTTKCFYGELISSYKSTLLISIIKKKHFNKEFLFVMVYL